jgi:hypothetical protein
MSGAGNHPERRRSMILRAKGNALMAISVEVSYSAAWTRSLGEQDILIHCLSLDRRGPEINNGGSAPMGAAGGTERGPTSWVRRLDRGDGVASTVKRRRSRQAVSRPKVVQFSLTEEEFDQVSKAAARSGLARGAFAADVTLAAARSTQSRVGSPLREALVELIAAAGLVRRVGTNLNQAVTRLNATGQRSDDLLPAAQFCVRVIRRLDEAAEQLRRSVP